MKVLITGGAGYISYNLINKLHENMAISEIIIYDNLAYSSLNFMFGKYLPKVKFIKGDILDTPKLEDALKGVEIVYHLAAYVQDAYNYMQSLQYHQVNQWGTLSLTRAISKIPSVSKLIYVSSTAVYGFKDDIDAGDNPSPSNAYAESKYLGEKYVLGVNDTCDTHIVRLANVYGYNSCFRRDSVINSFVLEALLNNRVLIYGAGDQKRSFISLNKAAERLSELIATSGRDKLHVVYDFSASVNEIHKALLGANSTLEYSFVNQETNFQSQSFRNSRMNESHEAEIVATYEEFKEHLRILKK